LDLVGQSLDQRPHLQPAPLAAHDADGVGQLALHRLEFLRR
jgi:hypothetical protein